MSSADSISNKEAVWNALLSMVVCFFQYMYILSIDFGKSYTIFITGFLSVLMVRFLLLKRYGDQYLKKKINHSAVFHIVSAALSLYTIFFWTESVSAKAVVLVILAISNMIYDMLKIVPAFVKKAISKDNT